MRKQKRCIELICILKEHKMVGFQKKSGWPSQNSCAAATMFATFSLGEDYSTAYQTHIQGGFFNWPPPKKYVKPRLGLGVSTLT